MAVATVAVDAKELLKQAVVAAISALNNRDDSGSLGKTLSKRKLKEFASNLRIGSLLNQSDAERRRATILQVGQSRDLRALELIEPLQADTWAIVRQAVATAVGELGDPRGVPVALTLMCDADAGVVRESVKSLRLLANPATIRPLMFLGLSNASLRIEALQAVVHSGEAAVSELLSIVEERNPHTIADAVKVLGRIGDKRAVHSLLMTLNDADSEIQPCIVEALGLLGDRTALARIVALLSAPDESVQLSAVQAVQRIPDRRAVKPVLAILRQTRNEFLKRQCVLALAASGSEKALPALSALLPEAGSDLQKAIAEALCRIKSPEASELLATLLDADDLSVVTRALIGFRENPPPATVPALIRLSAHASTTVRRHALEALVESGDSATGDLLEERLLNDPAAEVRTAAARGLGRVGDKRSIPLLEQSLKDERTVRCAALVSLAGLGDISAIPAMLASLKDSAPEVRYHAVSGLGKLKAESAERSVRAMLEDESDMVRAGAEKALLSMGHQNVQLPRSSRMMNRAVRLIPNQLAGALPVRQTLAGIALFVSVVLAGWFYASSSTAGTENALALARARGVTQARWIPGTTDVILLRTDGPADIWEATTGTFRKKIDTPAIEEFVSLPNLVSRRKDTLVPWVPDGPKPSDGTIKLPPSDRFEFSGNAAIAVYISEENRTVTWDTAEGKPVGELLLGTTPVPVLNADGSVVAGADKDGNIVVLDRLSGNLIGKPGEIGSVSLKTDGKFLRMMFSATGNSLAVFRHDRVVVGDVSDGAIAVSTVNERIHSRQARFPDPSGIYSTSGTSVIRLDLATKEVTKWTITNRQVTLNSWSLSADESLAVASAEGKKYGWVLNLKDGSSKELSPTVWPVD